MENTVITQRLGRLTSAGGVKVKGMGSKNATRWVFDVDYCPVQQAHDMPDYGNDVVINLLLPYRSTPIPSVVSYSLAPLSREFWDAGIYIVEDTSEPVSPLTFFIRGKKACKFRVTIDTVSGR